MTTKLNLSPDPRILPILGEINLPQERCLAELIDNAIDAFAVLHENGALNYSPKVMVETPSEQVRDNAKISVRDNGPGMDTERLARAVSAGWTGNNSVDRLGLFGMGFNISTARLGGVTQVWTTLAGEDTWRGIEIDFQKMIREKNFETDLIFRAKTDKSRSGTEITVTKLKPQQADWFKKNINRNKLKKFFGQVYSSVLKEDASPFKIELSLNGQTIVPHRHCVWSDHQEGRTVHHATHGEIEVFQKIDNPLHPKKYCRKCMSWLPSDMDECPTCETGDHIIVRKRRIHGWIGILRYLSDTDYGIDFIRNGRKIELLDRSLFKWAGDNGLEDEYPIDDLRNKGRIVGEIHIDHCRVSYTKDRFERDDPAWSEMVGIIRGEGPLRPDIARALNYGPNTSPLFLFYQAFRRATPGNKKKIHAGTYSKLLSVPNNDLALEYAKKFAEGVPEFQSDAKWYALIEEADRELIRGAKPAAQVHGGALDDDELEDVISPPVGIIDANPVAPTPIAPTTVSSPVASDSSPTPSVAHPPRENPVASLSQVYVDDISGERFDVSAFEVEDNHPDLENGIPWSLKSDSRRRYKFVFNKQHLIFYTTSFLPLEGLLTELAHKITSSTRDLRQQYNFASILAGLRRKYHPTDTIDFPSLLVEAKDELNTIAQTLSKQSASISCETIYENMEVGVKRAIQNAMARAGAIDPQEQIVNGSFLTYAPYHYLVEFIKDHPEFFFDGKLWVSRYTSINFDDPEATELARNSLLAHHLSLVNDLVWLANKDSFDNDPIELTRIVRARMALDILRSYRDE